MIYILYLFIIIFFYINIKIIISDLKIKKIPNKYLGYLLLLIPFWWIFLFLSPISGFEIWLLKTNLILFSGQIFLTFLVSFTLYYFGIWAAGDAKYLLVLSLFIPNIGIIPFIGNIGLITIAYLFLYFIWFYLGKIVFNKVYRQNLWGNIKQDLNEKWEIYKGNKGGEDYKIITKLLLIFFILFVSIRLIRLYLLNLFFHSNTGNFQIIQRFIEKYNIYLVFLSILIFIGLLYLFKLGINKLKIYISKKFKINLKLVGDVLLIFLTIFLVSFIVFEYLQNPNEIKNHLFRIFTIYLIIYLITKILIFSYKIAFGIAEYQYVDIKDLKESDMVDKEYLIKMFGEQSSLGYISKTTEKKKKKQRRKYLLFPSPKNYFQNINNPIDKKTLNIIKKCYFITNKWHINNKTHNFRENNIIKTLNTFSFAPYIIFGFLLTFFFQNKIFITLLNFFIKIIKNLSHYQ